ncbi:MAG: LysM peptidoglycan-binding domain-containing protein, partial [Candidatus Gracilibacteria bacterium]|nr:LysM peptidoglycan-binding domain-containing protein [Candidatus Gracilibacteria bacterium]
MASKINFKARIDRHSRILKNNLGNVHPFRSLYYKWNYNLVLFSVLFLFPVYPLFSAFVNASNEYNFDRAFLDESTIVDSYIDGDEFEVGELQDYTTSDIFEDNSFLSINTIIDNGKRDLSGNTEVIEYEVKPGDSFSTIAYKFGISGNSIYWANDFKTNKVLQPGEKIKIPPVTGVIHKVEKGDTLLAIAKKYKVDTVEILTQNGLTIDSNLIAGREIIVPGAEKIIEKPVVISTVTNVVKNKTTTSQNYSFSNSSSIISGSTSGEYQLVKRTPTRKFYWGNCTWYVAQYKNVTWNGNANQWLRNAKSVGVATGSKAEIGSIIVFNGRGYNPRYGHVGIVVNRIGNDIIIKDMNYRRLNEVTTRKISINDPSIIGYIYV